MRNFVLTHLSDAVLLRDLAALVAQDRLTTAALLAHIAEVDARRLYAPAGYPSMHAYCVEELRLSEDAALRRIQAARAGRQFPVLFAALTDCRLHLTAVCLLAPYLTPENVDRLVEAAAYRRKPEIEEMLARLFARKEGFGTVRAIVPVPHACARECDSEHALAHVVNEITKSGSAFEGQRTAGHGDDARSEIVPGASERYLIKIAVGKSTHDKLRYAQALLSHAVPSGDVAQVLDRALDVLITQLEKRKFGAGPEREPRRLSTGRRTTTGRASTAYGRYVPAHVRRAVWERDEGQCTFVGAGGHRCGARRFLEFDHVCPVARGGETTVEGLRLRCRAHNQYEAERAFGEEFMAGKRREARLAAAAKAAAKEAVQDVLAGLRGLGCRADEARHAAEFSQTLHGAPLEERMRAALRFLWRPATGQPRVAGRKAALVPTPPLHHDRNRLHDQP